SVEGLALIACAAYWNLRPVKNAALGLFAITLVKLLLTESALSYPADTFVLLANPRAVAFFTLAAALGASALVLKRRGPLTGSMVMDALNYGWCLLIFTLLAVETNDYFTAHIAGAPADVQDQLAFNRVLVIGLVLIGYSVALTSFGAQTGIRAVAYSGIGVLLAAWFVIELRSIEYSPLADFTLLLNTRAGAVVLTLAALLFHIRLLRHSPHPVAGAGSIARAILLSACLLAFTLVTAETADYFRHLRLNASGDEATRLQFTEWMALVIVWTAYSLVLIWYGLRRKARAVMWFGLAALALAAVWGA